MTLDTIKPKFPSYKNKKVLILGLGLLGRGIKDTIFFAKQGAKVIVTDLKTKKQLEPALKLLSPYKNITFVLGRHRFEDIDRADLIIRNADVPFNSKFLQYALKQGKNVDMDESLFAEYCPCPIIGVTGTRGKTTTTILIAELLKSTGRRVHLAGNIQGEATLPLITKVKSSDLVVLELSSWQLQGFGWKKISPHVAVFTNIYPDHLNRYKNMTEYINDKKHIYKHQTTDDFLIINRSNPTTKKLIKEANSRVITFSQSDFPPSYKTKLPGAHNKENIAAAIQVAKLFGVKAAAIKQVIASFPGVAHRLEFVKTINGIDFYNDTTSTTPIAGQKALASFTKPIYLIAGGATKKLDLTDFGRSIAKKAKLVALLDGTATDALESAITKYQKTPKIVGRFDNLETAVKTLYAAAKPGSIILLSPGCASFGLFANEFDRGDQFKRIVKKLS
ncbi:TPA: UDP-N-acetylmuramoyl-L-alanine--D-glutamate ligase [Candidatus Falkowbacteria bacterium]|nr:UDP-N-acetylmuramoyl-L-alanine--D-glutamate ligase [Candidatus Falkowbacteria bacterium]